MKSAFVDGIKLLVTNQYRVSDREYKALSDTLLGCTGNDAANALNVLKFLCFYRDITLPYLTVQDFSARWDSVYKEPRSGELVSYLLTKSLIHLRKMSDVEAADYQRIAAKSPDTEVPPVRIELSDSLQSILDTLLTFKRVAIVESAETCFKCISGILGVNEMDETIPGFSASLNDYISEGTNVRKLPKASQRMIAKIIAVFKESSGIRAELESYAVDDALNVLEVCFTLSAPNIPVMGNKEYYKLIRQYVKPRQAQEISVFKESDSLFLSMTVPKDRTDHPDLYLELQDFSIALMSQDIVEGYSGFDCSALPCFKG